jgi:hypothetical protein
MVGAKPTPVISRVSRSGVGTARHSLRYHTPLHTRYKYHTYIQIHPSSISTPSLHATATSPRPQPLPSHISSRFYISTRHLKSQRLFFHHQYIIALSDRLATYPNAGIPLDRIDSCCYFFCASVRQFR